MQDIGIDIKIIESIKNIFSEYPEVEQVILYGSRAKGNFRPSSDIDLTIKGSINLSILNKIEQEIDNLNTPYTFDISIFNHISNTDLLSHIERVGIVFYSQTNR